MDTPIPVTLIGITLPALTFALSIDRVLNGLTRPFFGWVSDYLGRENTNSKALAKNAAETRPKTHQLPPRVSAGLFTKDSRKGDESDDS